MPRLYRAPLQERLMAHVAIAESGCWEWTAARQKDGYGIIGYQRRSHLAHRIAYETFVGPIPSGLELDHLCRVRHCIRPDHLEPVLHVVNVQRGVRTIKTHCKRGHAFTPENTRLTSTGGRRCVRCLQDYQRAYEKVHPRSERR